MPVLLNSLKALADETRLRLVRVLMEFELNVKELTQVLAMGQSRISRHLKILTEAGLATARRDGLKVFYSIPAKGRARGLLTGLMDHLEPGEIPDLDLDRARQAIEARAEQTSRLFNRLAGDYDRLQQEVLGRLHPVSLALERMAPCSTAVDLGCGDGSGMAALAAKAEQVIGVDASPGMLKLAEERLAELNGRVSLRIGRLEHLPLADGEAGFAMLSMALHHLSHPTEGLAEAFRVLAPGGRLVLVDFEKHDFEKMRTTYGDHWLGFEPGRISAWLERIGFKITENLSLPTGTGMAVQLISADKPG